MGRSHCNESTIGLWSHDIFHRPYSRSKHLKLEESLGQNEVDETKVVRFIQR